MVEQSLATEVVLTTFTVIFTLQLYLLLKSQLLWRTALSLNQMRRQPTSAFNLWLQGCAQQSLLVYIGSAILITCLAVSIWTLISHRRWDYSTTIFISCWVFWPSSKNICKRNIAVAFVANLSHDFHPMTARNKGISTNTVDRYFYLAMMVWLIELTIAVNYVLVPQAFRFHADFHAMIKVASRHYRLLIRVELLALIYSSRPCNASLQIQEVIWGFKCRTKNFFLP